MLSVGTDLIEINRIAKSLQNRYFLEKIFGQRELEELEKRGLPAQSAAAAFAAKEAFSKAIGTGLTGFSMREVEVLHNDRGAPYFYLTGRAKELVEGRNLRFSLSLTHSMELAQAVVIAYEPEDRLDC